MITIPDTIKKYFKIINEETIVLRPPISKILPHLGIVFGLPIMMFLIVFADCIDEIHLPTLYLAIFLTSVFFSYGYFIALPGLRERITFDFKNRIIHIAYGRRLENKDECFFDDAAFSYDTDFIQISSDSFTSSNVIYFLDIKHKVVFFSLKLKQKAVEYEDMLFFLQELCKSNQGSNSTP